MSIKEIIHKAFSIQTFALFATLVVYAIIVTTLHQGISCDEGFYLMGYLHNQPLGSFISDYANIVRAITPQAWEENIMVYRYERLVLFIISISLFSYSFYKWLKNKYSVSINKTFFFSLMFLSGAMTYTFATPTISYDSIQTIVYLFVFSFLFLSEISSRNICRDVFSILSGAISIIGVLNYFPSGLFLVGFIFVWILLNGEDKKILKLLYLLLGIALSLIFYHFFISNLIEYFGSAFETIVKVFTEKSDSGHDSGGLITSFATRLGLFLIFVPGIYLFSILFRKVKLNKIVVFLLVGVVTLSLLLYREIYSAVYAPLFFVPIALLFAALIAEKEALLKEKKELIFIGLLILLPFFGVFGTNQNMFAKMLIFMPFWLIVFFVLLLKVNNKRLIQIASLLMVVTLFAGYVYLGNFSRYHYYYTPRSSIFLIENIERKQKATISKYQQEYYKELSDTLKTHGAKKGDTYLAFGENQMTVFLMGGYVAGNLPYHWFQYKSEDFADERPKFFILFKNEEREVINLLKETDWNFPKHYNRIEMRAMSENMDQEELKTIVYALKSRKSEAGSRK